MNRQSLLEEVEILCQNQLTRISNQLESGEAPTFTNPVASAMPALHAVGKRKPSLSELDKQSPAKAFNQSRRLRF